MIESASTKELIELLIKQSGIKKKLAAKLLHTIPEIIEGGLKRDGEVRVKGLGTFRMKWTKGRTGRNPKTGESVEIPPHNRLTFLPEKSFKEYINRDYRLLSYKIIPAVEQELPEQQINPEPQPQPEPEPGHSIEYQIESLLESEPESQPQPQPESPPVKRRVHWIVPVAVSVIVILSLIFYFRNFYHKDVGSQQSAVGSQQSAVDSQQSAVDSKQSAVGSQQSAVDSQQSAVDSQQSAVGSQQSAVDSQQSAVGSQQSVEPTQNSELKTVPEGSHLFNLAREVYGNPYLWVLIYKANKEKIPDPDLLISGLELVIPSLEGKPDKLSRNDSQEVAEGYRLVYEFYKAKNDSRAVDFHTAFERYKPL